MTPGTIVFTLTGPGGSVPVSAVSYDSGTNTATWSPVSPLTHVTTYTMAITAATSTLGVALEVSASQDFITITVPTSNTYWAATTGSDSNPGTQVSPWLTLQHACAQLNSGDTLNIMSGSYAGVMFGNDIQLAPAALFGVISGQPGYPITIQADSSAAPGTVIINSRNVHSSCGIDFDFGGSYITLINLTIYNSDGSIGYGMKLANGGNFIVQGCTAHACLKTGIFSSFINDSVFTGCTSYSNSEHGFYMSNSPERVTVTACTSYSNATAGIQMNADATQGGGGTGLDCVFTNNICYNNNVYRHSGTLNFYGLQNSLIANNLLFECNGTGLVLWDGDATAGCVNNIVANNTIVMLSNTRGAGLTTMP